MQKNIKSKVWWIGLVIVIAQGLCGILTATGNIDNAVSGTITALFAAVLAYCNGNNPSLVGTYSYKDDEEV